MLLFLQVIASSIKVNKLSDKVSPSRTYSNNFIIFCTAGPARWRCFVDAINRFYVPLVFWRACCIPKFPPYGNRPWSQQMTIRIYYIPQFFSLSILIDCRFRISKFTCYLGWSKSSFGVKRLVITFQKNLYIFDNKLNDLQFSRTQYRLLYVSMTSAFVQSSEISFFSTHLLINFTNWFWSYFSPNFRISVIISPLLPATPFFTCYT